MAYAVAVCIAQAPHHLVIDMGAVYKIGGMNTCHGRIRQTGGLKILTRISGKRCLKYYKIKKSYFSNLKLPVHSKWLALAIGKLYNSYC